jgi:hypothetical protein
MREIFCACVTIDDYSTDWFVAEGAGFEPAIRFPAYTLSRRAPSTARPPLHALFGDEREPRAIAPAAARAQAILARADPCEAIASKRQ